MTISSVLHSVRCLGLMAAVLVLGACAGPRTYAESSSIDLVDGASLPPPRPEDLMAESRPYLLGPFDKVTINVFGVPDLTARQVQLDASGNISFPLTGSVSAAGLTPTELAEEIERRLREAYVRNPQVTVNLEETVSQMITVDGQVSRPGLYPVLGKMTLIRAVARAGGTAEFARLDDVVIQRSVNGQTYLALYNLGAIRQGNYADPEVFANDVVVVGESKSRRMFRDLVSASALFTSPLVAILRN